MPERLLTPEGTAASLREFAHDGAELVAEAFGEGERTLVLLHGIGMGRSVFVELVRVLPGRVIGIDLPGFGEAPEPAEPLAMAAHADLVAAFLREAGERETVVIGHSMGSQVAVELAARHPDLVAGLVLAGPTVDRAARSILRQALALFRDLLRERRIAVLWRGGREYLRGGPNLIAKMRATIAHEPERALAEVRCPVLVLRGAHDPMATERWCSEILRVAVDARVEAIPDHGHGTLLSDAAPAARLISAFLSRL